MSASTSETVKKMKNGELLKDKKVLMAMKRMGLISGYADTCMIDSVKVPYTGGYIYMELFPKMNLNELNGKTFESKDAIHEVFGKNRTIKYENCLFTTQCVNGGVKPFLVKVGSVKS